MIIKNGQMDLSDRPAMKTGICHKISLTKIAQLSGRHSSMIAHEIKGNRTFIPGNYFLRSFMNEFIKKAPHSIG